LFGIIICDRLNLTLTKYLFNEEMFTFEFVATLVGGIFDYRTAREVFV